MTNIFDVFETEPFFVNEEGTKWWHDEQLTSYCRKEDQFGTKFDGNVCYIETKEGYRSRVLVIDGKLVEEDQKLDSMAVKIEIRKLLIRELEKEENNKNKESECKKANIESSVSKE